MFSKCLLICTCHFSGYITSQTKYILKTQTRIYPRQGLGDSLPRQGGALAERLKELTINSTPQTPPEFRRDAFTFGSVSSGHGTDESSSYVDYTSDQSSGSRESDSSSGQSPRGKVTRSPRSSGSEGSRGSASSRGGGPEAEKQKDSAKGKNISPNSACCGVTKYRRIPLISPGLLQLRKGF